MWQSYTRQSNILQQSKSTKILSALNMERFNFFGKQKFQSMYVCGGVWMQVFLCVDGCACFCRYTLKNLDRYPSINHFQNLFRNCIAVAVHASSHPFTNHSYTPILYRWHVDPMFLVVMLSTVIHFHSSIIPNNFKAV